MFQYISSEGLYLEWRERIDIFIGFSLPLRGSPLSFSLCVL